MEYQLDHFNSCRDLLGSAQHHSFVCHYKIWPPMLLIQMTINDLFIRYLNNNLISVIPNGAFQGLTRLQQLYDPVAKVEFYCADMFR